MHVTLFSTGKDKQSFGFGGTGKKSFAGKFDDYGQVKNSCVVTVCTI